ncbi:hypothetical protein OFB94_32125, partial [Escherichia coli]|nr:hypothetical protein [Escherichia coli]
LRRLLEEAFPREMAARIVEDFSGIENSGQIFVNRKGDIRFGSRLSVYGRVNTDEKNASLLAFKRELSELSEEETKLADKAAL